MLQAHCEFKVICNDVREWVEVSEKFSIWRRYCSMDYGVSENISVDGDNLINVRDDVSDELSLISLHVLT